MQQVGRKAIASAIVVDPRRLPVRHHARKNNKGLIALTTRYWVLHRPIVLRAFLGVACAALIAAGFQARGGLSQAVVTLGDVMQGEFAAAGLGISAINITGQAITHEGAVLGALEIGDQTSIISFDAEAARQRLLELPAIDDVSIRKIYPNNIAITLKEKEPVARWRLADGTTVLIDARGEQVGAAQGVDNKLPLVIGDGAADDALVILRALELYPDITSGVIAVSRIADRRWDLIYKSGVRVQLPERGVAQALEALVAYQRDYKLLDRDVSQIDLRVNDMLAVRLNVPDEDDKSAS